MELVPNLAFGWRNGWIPLALLCLTEGLLLLAFPRDVVQRLFDRSNWSKRQAALTGVGKLFSLACIVPRLHAARAAILALLNAGARPFNVYAV